MRMRQDRQRRWPAAVWLASLGLLLAGTAAVPAPASGAWNEFGLRASAVPAAGDTIVEPFFAFVLGCAEADSLGTWDGVDVAAFAIARGRPSRLPVDLLVSVQRRRPAPGTEGRYAGARVLAEWVIAFDRPLGFPLPYSILGYHPGSLRLSRTLQLAELAAVDLTLRWREKRRQQERPLDSVRVFACEKGYLLLDADGVVDRLLGDLLDDSWTVGFVTARDGAARLGLGLMLGRDGRPIYGEFDFARDRIEAHGRPLAGALASAARRWLDPTGGLLPEPWVEE
ncbi:MAG: hypothetical protein IPK64_06085 [bacterium]|nr:hypothetical protein [bacterium]